MTVHDPGIRYHGEFPDLVPICNDRVPVKVGLVGGDFPHVDIVIYRFEQDMGMAASALQFLLAGQSVFSIDFHSLQTAQASGIVVVAKILEGDVLNMLTGGKKGHV
jgi:hypothetical protein